MSAKGSLKYTAYDGAGCTHREQAYSCVPLDGFGRGYYQLGLRLIHRPDHLTLGPRDADELMRMFTTAPNASMLHPDDAFAMHAKRHLYPQGKADPTALTIDFQVELGKRAEIGDVILTDKICPPLKTIGYDRLDAERKYDVVDPVLSHFRTDYKKMSNRSGNRAYRAPREMELGFAGQYTFAVNKLAQQALVKHLIDEDVDASFLIRPHGNEKYYCVQTAQEIKEQGGFITVSAMHRRVTDWCNVQQVSSVLKDSTQPIHSRARMQEFAATMNEATKAEENLFEYYAKSASELVMGRAAAVMIGTVGFSFLKAVGKLG